MILYLVIPCYNEESVLPMTAKVAKQKFEALISSHRISDRSRVVLIDDGSKDRTWSLISELHAADPLFSGIKLTRNRGHQNALLAGLETVAGRCDAAISLDADLQDDIDAIDEMLTRFEEGYDIVYGVRSSRDVDSAFKKSTALGFYRLMNAIGVELVYNHADYRLMSRRAIEALAKFPEVNLFLRGLVPMIGYKTTTVSYVRGKRAAGESKYPLKKMLSFALEGITSLSVKPIRLILAIGLCLLALCGIAALALMICALLGLIRGLGAWILVSVWVGCGLNLTALGMVGEYVGKIYFETKRRPRYLIEDELFANDNNEQPQKTTESQA